MHLGFVDMPMVLSIRLRFGTQVPVKWGYPIACKIWSLSRVEGDIDIDPAKQNNYAVHLSHINTCVFFTCTADIELAIITSFWPI